VEISREEVLLEDGEEAHHVQLVIGQRALRQGARQRIDLMQRLKVLHHLLQPRVRQLRVDSARDEERRWGTFKMAKKRG